MVSPVNGTVTVLFPNKHAVGIVSEEGVEMLIHIGMDIVSLDEKGFEAHMNKGIRLLLVKNLSLLMWKRLKVQVLSLKHQLSLQIKMIFKRMLTGIFHVISNVVIFL
ncbi:PTS trehalose transporter subunit IIBC [Streptococcus thermophilus]|nr:PTS trehalose transporter subunit IIBC [Streptococcus thermophilus]PJH83374.1 PTS trehalose transporter subunit IIBC [Streptococcus thermophilus]